MSKITKILNEHGDGILVVIALAVIIPILLKTGVITKDKPHTEYIHDTVTLTNIQFDTVYYTKTKTDTLPVQKFITIHDSVTFTDTVWGVVEIPIYTHLFDTSFSLLSGSGEAVIGIREKIRGYGVEVDSIVVGLDYTPVVLSDPKKLRLCPAVGLGYGTGGLGVFAGIGVTFR